MNRLFDYLIIMLSSIVTLASCSQSKKEQVADEPIRLVVVNPEHFHAALVQKNSLPGVSDSVTVISYPCSGLGQYTEYIDTYNSRSENPTSWVTEIVCVNEPTDALHALAQKNYGDVVILAGNNRYKAQAIYESIKAGYNVLADKPMAIDSAGFSLLENAYRLASEKGLIIYDLMTERYDTLNVAVRNIINDASIFGTLQDVAIESVHHFYKNVSGSALTRPQWYYDVAQQGKGVADVTTHLIDLVMWQCFPDSAIDYHTAVGAISSKIYPTTITPEQFALSTGRSDGLFPDYLAPYVSGGKLLVDANGEIHTTICNVPVDMAVRWDFEAPAGSGDTFTATYRGSKGTVEIVQDASTDFTRQLYYTPADGKRNLIIIPQEQRIGHEEQFAKVTAQFLSYLHGEKLPDWETVNTISKYYITTSAVQK